MARLQNQKPRLPSRDLRTSLPPPKVADAHYQSPAHRAWSAEVIRRAGGKCQAPNCGKTSNRMYADHIIELKDQGAPLDLTNGQCLCPSCHGLKTAQERAKRLQARPR